MTFTLLRDWGTVSVSKALKLDTIVYRVGSIPGEVELLNIGEVLLGWFSHWLFPMFIILYIYTVNIYSVKEAYISIVQASVHHSRQLFL